MDLYLVGNVFCGYFIYRFFEFSYKVCFGLLIRYDGNVIRIS